MAEIINLNRARKQRSRAEAKTKAEANRLSFGRTKAERQTTQHIRDHDAAKLDGHKLEKPK